MEVLRGAGAPLLVVGTGEIHGGQVRRMRALPPRVPHLATAALEPS